MNIEIVVPCGSVKYAFDSSASTFRVTVSHGFLYHRFTCRREWAEPEIKALVVQRSPLIRHPPDQLDLSHSQGFTLGQKQLLTQHRLRRLFGYKTHIPSLTELHRLMTAKPTAVRKIKWTGEQK